MGRTSDYTKQMRNEECENTVETMKKEIGKYYARQRRLKAWKL